MARRRRPSRRGLSIVELLVALAISAALLTATMVATDASFRAYAAAAEMASTQTSTRLVINRLLTLVRTSTAHEPMTLAYAQTLDPSATQTGTIIQSNFLELVDQLGRLIRIEYRADDQELWVLVDDDADLVLEPGETRQPMLGGVTAAVFHARHRTNPDGLLVLERGSIDLTVQPDRDTTLSMESDTDTAIRVVASTEPRRLE